MTTDGSAPVDVGSNGTYQPEQILTVNNVTHTFHSGEQSTRALSKVSLDVAKGQFVSLVGPSGCGKSTLLRALAGLITVDEGSVNFRDQQIQGPEPEDIGVIFQDARLFPWKTALDNVLFPTVLQKHDRKQARTHAAQLFELVGLQGFEQSFPHQLSGGMKQRVSIARGLIQNPHVLLMDEPFGALDEFTRESMGFELLRLWERTGVTIVFVTHSIDEAILLSDRIAVMTPRPGRLVEVVTVPLERPRDASMANSNEFVKARAHIREQFTLLRGSDGA